MSTNAPAQNMISRRQSISYHTVEIRRLKIFYREAGPANAPTVLLLHGFPLSSRMWEPLLPLLADKYHLIAPDYPGFDPPAGGHNCTPKWQRPGAREMKPTTTEPDLFSVLVAERQSRVRPNAHEIYLAATRS